MPGCWLRRLGDGGGEGRSNRRLDIDFGRLDGRDRSDLAAARADLRQTGWVRVVVTEIGWDGSMRRRALDTSGLTDAGRWENLIEQVLAFPPPYRAAPGSPVYVIHAADRAVLVGEQDLTGPLRDLVTTILAAGDPA